ncbi:uncharacterized protein YukE [Streptomyces sp. KhCrAH-43]|uniref:WXG100 family type VII secretion target n=1 Tax=unclassified Streptomyces TaxID=2593676 RepID=UPI0003751BBC|nr:MULTISPECIES: hypothetical protein [unclassified Streptomyces]MYS36217.1 hypothetical protein [Streptomyces sp. SID4920]MYX70846.1 hypothetical protein [Streptomyces sp. SID8373]RAJ55996.1 uncharacterized protein YukE [Streptomyces sp. KhCrAH-43]
MGDKGKLPPLNACYLTTDFENMSYEDMLAMVRSVDPTAIMGRGTALIDAQTEIEKIGTELKEHVSRTTWKGKGGDAFREWGDDFAKQTIKLADYAGAAGTSLQTAGQALSEVSKVIQGHSDATAMCYADEEKEKARLKAVDKARNEAIPQMNKLASYYMMAQQTISSQEEPVFKPLPAAALPATDYDNSKSSYGPSSGSNPATHSVSAVQGTDGSSGTYHHVTAQPDGSSSSISHVSTPAAHHVGVAPVTPGVPDTTGTNIDTVTMPDAPPVTSTPPTGGPPVAPVGGGGQNNIPPVVLPTQSLPNGPGGGGNRRTIPVAPVTDGGPRANPVGPVAAGDRRTMPVGPMGRGGGESVRTPGIHGGTPGRPVTGPLAGGQRGTVIGNERPGVGRPMMGGQGMGAAGSPMGRGGVGGAGGSRRLVTQPGGTVGEARGGGAGREFTPGGSGLVRESARPGAMGPMGGAMGGSRSAGRRPQRRDGEHPDYLEEDEATWATGDDVVPPVID